MERILPFLQVKSYNNLSKGSIPDGVLITSIFITYIRKWKTKLLYYLVQDKFELLCCLCTESELVYICFEVHLH
jgi:hypothetical protein